MKLRNSTCISDEKIREIINFVKPQGVTKFSIDIKQRTYSSGRAWCRSRRVLININPAGRFPSHFYSRPGKGYIPSTVFTMQEKLVHLVAHELRHIWQGIHKKGYRVWGSKGQYSERDADAYAIHMVREWRRK